MRPLNAPTRQVDAPPRAPGVLLVLVYILLAVAFVAWTAARTPVHAHSWLEDNVKAPSPVHIYSASGYDVAPLPETTVTRLAAGLDPKSFSVTQGSATEAPFCGGFEDTEATGTYLCKVCGLPLFRSADKYHSGTGWPSFFQAFDPQHIGTRPDHSAGMERTEVHCARCGAHLGHVFEDGPAPTGLRYCLNSAALDFVPAGEALPAASQPVAVQDAYFAGGCFWGVEDAFSKVEGVIDAESGYSGGALPNPSYEQVSTGRTGYAETVHVRFDASVVTYQDLVRYFFRIHDPTTLDRQGPDVGSQYRSAIFTVDKAQAEEARKVEEEFASDERHLAGRRIVTAIEPLRSFHRAEEYHQDYDAKHGRACNLPSQW